jgi:hypothetical protein
MTKETLYDKRDLLIIGYYLCTHLASVTLAVVLAEGRTLALSTMAPLAFVLAY